MGEFAAFIEHSKVKNVSALEFVSG